jgi:glutaredoxin
VKIILVTAERECDKCRQAKETLARLKERFPEVEVRQLQSEDLEAAPYGVVMSPTVIVDETIIASGRAPNAARLTSYVESILGGTPQGERRP